MKADYTEFDFGPGSKKRWEGQAKFQRLDLSEGWRYALSAAVDYAQDFDPLPSGLLALHRETDQSLVDVSVGYSTRPAPATEKSETPI